MTRKVLLVLFALVATIGLSAQDVKTNTKTETTRKACFVDKDANGICDNYESGVCKQGKGKGLQNGNGEGFCKGRGQGKGRCVNKVNNGLEDGSGRNNGGRRARFTDANNNGVCDYKEVTKEKLNN